MPYRTDDISAANESIKDLAHTVDPAWSRYTESLAFDEHGDAAGDAWG